MPGRASHHLRPPFLAAALMLLSLCGSASAQVPLATPVLTYGSYVNGIVNAVTVDGAGSIYLAGYGTPADLPQGRVFSRAPLRHGLAYAFVSKLDASGSRVLYTDILGGPGGVSVASGLALGAQGEVLVAG